MPLINLEIIETFEVDEAVVKCSMCKAEMKPAAMSLQDRLIRLLVGASTIITHYHCPDCHKELITMEK